MTELPRWRSHKIVEAAQIVYFKPGLVTVLQGVDLLSELGDIPVPDNFHARGVPPAGAYFIRYDDGYVSWSPAKTFEDGYLLLHDRSEPATQIGFGPALDLLLAGQAVARTEWLGRKLLILIRGSHFTVELDRPL